MSMPSIPGFTAGPSNRNLADLWPMPSLDFPGELWPVEDLRAISNNPTGWLLVEEHFYTEAKHGGTGCVLVRPDQSSEALSETSWIGRDLGKVGIWSSGPNWDEARFDNGLQGKDRDVNLQFFAHGRRPSGATLPVIEITYPFLWYWDAFPIDGGWQYLNRAGREQDLIRWQRTEDSWKIEVRALEFRQFLAACGQSAILQVDYVHKIEHDAFDRADDEYEDDWAHFDFHVLHESLMGSRPAYSRLIGQYVIAGLRNSRVPRFEERRQDREYPTFIYGVDSNTGEPLTHVCEPDKLGTYFDKDGTRLHYLTPIYFKREVLQPYAAEPTRYRLSSSRLSCLDLWGVDISFNSAGLVEVYLGDLGRDLPSDEWGHWRSYNVPPEGTMDEGRFRRDFLNQWASSRDVVGDLRRARQTAIDISTALMGSPIWKPLSGEIEAEFESLIGPITNDATSLGGPLLVLTKVLVDGIDNGPLKSNLSNYDKGDQSIRLLQRYLQQLGDAEDSIAILRELQSFRSKGGIAHLAGSQKAKAVAALEITGMSSLEAFESVVVRLTHCLNTLTGLMNAHLADAGDAAQGGVERGNAP